MSVKILAQIARSRAGFAPQTIEGVAALYVARAFRDVENARDYAHLIDSIGLRAAAECYRAARAAGGPLPAQRERFRAVSGSDGHSSGFSLSSRPIIALRVERRAICVAVFLGTELHYTEVHALPGDRDPARSSAAGLIRWCLAHFADGLLAMESREERPSTRSRDLSLHVVEVAREGSAAVWEVSPWELTESLQEPPARTRARFRDSVATIWPSVAQESGSRALLDAVGLGLFVSIKRLFGDTDPEGAGL